MNFSDLLPTSRGCGQAGPNLLLGSMAHSSLSVGWSDLCVPRGLVAAAIVAAEAVLREKGKVVRVTRNSLLAEWQVIDTKGDSFACSYSY
jgi:hypothetical protein